MLLLQARLSETSDLNSELTALNAYAKAAVGYRQFDAILDGHDSPAGYGEQIRDADLTGNLPPLLQGDSVGRTAAAIWHMLAGQR
jgi:hypothetical protein